MLISAETHNKTNFSAFAFIILETKIWTEHNCYFEKKTETCFCFQKWTKNKNKMFPIKHSEWFYKYFSFHLSAIVAKKSKSGIQRLNLKSFLEKLHIPVEGGLSSPAAYFPITPPHLLSIKDHHQHSTLCHLVINRQYIFSMN